MDAKGPKARKILIASLSQGPYTALVGGGHQILWATTTNEALSKAGEEEPDLLIVEGRLQFIKGSWNKKYSEKGKGPPPVLLVCSPGQVGAQISAFDLPVTDHLLEGFTAEDLQTRIGFLLSRRRLDLTVMRDNFLDIMVYDIRAPLASILVGLEFLIGGEKDLNAVQKKVVHTLFYGCTDLKGILENFLDLERMDAEEPKTQRAKLDSQAMLREVVESVKPLLDFREVKVHFESAMGLPPIWGDEKPLKRALANLVLSAGKLSDPSTLVTVKTKPHDDGLYFLVENLGHTIPPEARNHIFDRYFHRGKGGWIFPRGFGTSLAYCYRILEAHGGRIWLEANAPTGNRFHVVLPTVV